MIQATQLSALEDARQLAQTRLAVFALRVIDAQKDVQLAAFKRVARRSAWKRPQSQSRRGINFKALAYRSNLDISRKQPIRRKTIDL